MAEIAARAKADRYSQSSLLSTSEFTLRFFFSVAETFVKLWMRFPVSLIAANVERIGQLLSAKNTPDFGSDGQPSSAKNTPDFGSDGAFSLGLLQEAKEALVCVNAVVVEIIRFVFACLFVR